MSTSYIEKVLLESIRHRSEHTFVRPSTRPFASNTAGLPCALSAADGHFVAGFLEAESSFGVRPNNGGESWQCSMALSLRADDAELLAGLARLTGLGRLSARAAQGTSNPQVVWKIVSLAECIRLADLLREFPLRGRKRREVTIWSDAARALIDHPRPARLPQAHAQLRELRRYVDPETREPETVVLPSEAVAAYFGGFFTGEGHLCVSRTKCGFAVRVRKDDRPLLQAFAAATELGRIYLSPAYGSSRPAAAWVVNRRDQLIPAVELLDRAGLRGRKAREYEAWREAALEFAKPVKKRSRDVIDRAGRKVARTRAYCSAERSLIRSDRREIQRRGLVEVLTQAAGETDGLLTTPKYAAARASHPEWPTRDTIARAFGSWAAALASAGLGSRSSSRARACSARHPQEYTARDLHERGAVRGRVLESVVELATHSHGERAPTVHDYLAHRAAHDRSLPSLSRLYNLFPGGWWSVLRQAGLPARPPVRS